MSQLDVQTDGVRSYAQIHDRVATDLSQVIDGPDAEAAGVQASHGTIAAAVGAALSSALGTRRDTVQATASSGMTIAELLREAARRYDEGDREGADKLRAAAEALDSQQGAGSPPVAAGPAATTASSPGGDQMAGQLLGQVGQQVGQAVGGLTASLAGLAQGLAQVPQQIMQAVQGAAGSSADDKARPDAYDEADRNPVDDQVEEPSDQDRTPSTERAVEDQAVDHADAGPAASGRAPGEPAEAQRPQPAQTRPQGG